MNSVDLSDWGLKQGNPGRCEGEEHEQRTHQTEEGEGEPGVWAGNFESPIFKEKDRPGGNIEDGDVQPVRGLAEGPVIGVKQHRDQRKPQQGAPQLDPPEIFLPPEAEPLNQRKEKQRPI